MARMRREAFEEWLEEHREEALSYIEDAPRSTDQWIKLYAKALKAELYEADEDDDDGEDESLFG